MAVRNGRKREELERFYRSGGTHRLTQRAQAILLSSRGYRVEALAPKLRLKELLTRRRGGAEKYKFL